MYMLVINKILYQYAFLNSCFFWSANLKNVFVWSVFLCLF